MGACWRQKSYPPEVIYRFETAVNELLASGADALARDGLGNTVLHYLASTRLGENDRMGDEQRWLLRAFLNPEVGVDATARNTDGVSALEIFLSTGDDDIFYEEYDPVRYNAIGEEVIGAFEQAGYVLTEPNAAGETLLHVVARLCSGRAYEWFKILRAKGLDPLSKNKEGRTAYDIAKENDDLRFTDLF
jgi:ankyrin repeat protein